MRYLLLAIFLFLGRAAFGQSLAAEDSLRHQAMNETVVIQAIHITGNKKTKNKIILRELSVEEGQSVPARSLNELIEKNRGRLASISLFTDINISFDTLDASSVTMHINVKERWFILPEVDFKLADRNFNVWWKEQNRDIRRSTIGLSLNHTNFRGNLENITVTGQIGYRQEFLLGYAKPYLDKDQKHGIGFLIGVSQSSEVFYKTDSNKLVFVKKYQDHIIRQFQASASYSYRPAYSAFHVFRISYKEHKVSDTVPQLNPEYFLNNSKSLKLLELGYRYQLNKTDNWNYPLKGTKVIAQAYYLKGLQGMDQMVIGALQSGHFYNPRGKWYVSAIFRGRIALFQPQPYVLRAALGTKYDYVRGYEYYVVDGSHFAVSRLNLKRELLNISIRRIPFKYLPVIPIRIYPKIFADAGYAHNPYPGNSFLHNKMLYAGGAGLDIFTAYDFKVRFEYAWNHLGQKGLFLHFSSE